MYASCLYSESDLVVARGREFGHVEQSGLLAPGADLSLPHRSEGSHLLVAEISSGCRSEMARTVHRMLVVSVSGDCCVDGGRI